jgi:prepilin-type N-terminal cleavage/methylation domain-containing protein
MIPLSFIKKRFEMKQQKGFTLVELIVTLVLVGIIGTFTTLFMYTGLNGYLKAKVTSEGALKAQIALDRISLELRDIKDISDFNSDTNIDYTSETLPGNRKIILNGNKIDIDVNNNPNTLLDAVVSFDLKTTYTDLNYYSGGDREVESISVGFTVEGIERPFSTRIFPRYMVPEPP